MVLSWLVLVSRSSGCLSLLLAYNTDWAMVHRYRGVHVDIDQTIGNIMKMVMNALNRPLPSIETSRLLQHRSLILKTPCASGQLGRHFWRLFTGRISVIRGASGQRH